ncbi:regulatory signaling modulator protein AmpE [Erwinia sp. OLTSP20]|uniref:beta-lactamase regulator AmpE n=1 Tax=unclassified Erwinia TaxID=2622719 RepID=UPI000C176CF3|nr:MULTISPECIES: beta-lactamase regulator AmpE [unclassified Erwinia]PIJ49768.1 regulatory signaling modulator protein AmpE [Erwinia sp. OAMSP11]PIJ70867.1 regulatory signaling modulator protein AmpE [Erwinia sp. OLSSP12]PIJ80232.1 regulatory signaling modulator protein AmpE [Erwinia sp. OLCASP19]PIJ82356.1 regulatory signaling modulator protein AmpE [Erwinia sp. OLMTSP26]PIJ85042.1 regulatory signaling modulator protein AmpE [Erwinia sp. OLMDSP33]
MTLFSLLLVLGWERLFKMGQHWQIEHRLEPVMRQQQHYSLPRTLLLTLACMLLTAVCIDLLKGWFFGFPQLIFWILLGVLCIGAGGVRLHYHRYLQAASRGDTEAHQAMVEELTLIHGVPHGCDEASSLRELQNALLWINYRFYLAPMLWFVAGGQWGPVLLIGYATLRAWQSWLARHKTPLERAQSGVDGILHWVDWLPVRLVGVAYALLGHGERALPAWFASLGDRHSAQYQVLTQLAQFSLARDPHHDKIATPQAAVSLAKRVSWMMVVVVALLTIYGTLV